MTCGVEESAEVNEERRYRSATGSDTEKIERADLAVLGRVGLIDPACRVKVSVEQEGAESARRARFLRGYSHEELTCCKMPSHE